jgi:hypothetical protein
LLDSIPILSLQWVKASAFGEVIENFPQALGCHGTALSAIVGFPYFLCYKFQNKIKISDKTQANSAPYYIYFYIFDY